MDNDSRKLTPARVPFSPVDRCNLVYLIFYLLGIGSLMPWNFFITANEYFQFKLRNTTIPVDYSSNLDGPKTDLQGSFEAYIAIASAVSNFIFTILNAACTNIIPLKVRMVGSLILMLVMFALTDGMVFVNTDNWQTNFFILTLVTVVVTSGATSVMCGALFGLSGQFPPRYTQAAMSGQAMGGTFAALANVLSLAASGGVTASAFGFFLSAVIVTFLSILGFIALYYMHFSQFYMGKNIPGGLSNPINYTPVIQAGDEDVADEEITSEDEVPLVAYKPGLELVFKSIWPQAIAVCFIFLVTIAVFPGVCSAIQSVQKKSGSPITNEFFSPLVCFLVFNAGDWAGRMLAGWIHLIRKDQSLRLILVTVFRVVLIPLILLCNAHPRHNLPVIFTNDALPVLFIVLLGVSNGYAGTIAMMHAPQKVPVELAEVTGSWMAVFIAGGLAVGSLLSLGLVKLM